MKFCEFFEKIQNILHTENVESLGGWSIYFQCHPNHKTIISEIEILEKYDKYVMRPRQATDTPIEFETYQSEILV